jgi:ABC-type Fe3+/spermidine/putrescine transport system ATPase subunit
MNVVELRNVVKRFGGVLALDNVSISIKRGRWTAILGPSGCGKTTTLRIVAGLLHPDEGVAYLEGADARNKRPYERNIGLVFQSYALFPHLTVEKNIAYGMRHRGVERRLIPGKVKEVLAIVKLTGYEQRWPSQLSGGEQQRVALARALVTKPAVLLLDEPLSNLDAKLRHEMRSELKEILAVFDTTPIIVTHDQYEAMSLGAEVILMNRGRVVQVGTPTEIYEHPNSKFTADFIGETNWFSGSFLREAATGLWEYETTWGAILLVACAEVEPESVYQVGVRPERITIFGQSDVRSNEGTDAINALPCVIERVDTVGAEREVWAKLHSGAMLHSTTKHTGHHVGLLGSNATAVFSPEDCMPVKARD